MFFQVAEARREADEKRNAKYAKMERQREEVRQNIREKVIPLKSCCFFLLNQFILFYSDKNFESISVLWRHNCSLIVFCLVLSRNDKKKHASFYFGFQYEIEQFFPKAYLSLNNFLLYFFSIISRKKKKQLLHFRHPVKDV